MTTFRLTFLRVAEKEWSKLGATIQRQFIKKLRERLTNPHVSASRLHDMPDCYKIKLRKAGYRLVYRVHESGPDDAPENRVRDRPCRN